MVILETGGSRIRPGKTSGYKQVLYLILNMPVEFELNLNNKSRSSRVENTVKTGTSSNNLNEFTFLNSS